MSKNCELCGKAYGELMTVSLPRGFAADLGQSHAQVCFACGLKIESGWDSATRRQGKVWDNPDLTQGRDENDKATTLLAIATKDLEQEKRWRELYERTARNLALEIDDLYKGQARMKKALQRALAYIQEIDDVHPMEAAARGEGYSKEAQPIVDSMCDALASPGGVPFEETKQPPVEAKIVAGENLYGEPFGRVSLRVPDWVFKAGLVRMGNMVKIYFGQGGV